LYFGLSRLERSLRLAGFILFGLILIKLSFYDLTSLDSVQRAVAFMTVGALMLTGSFLCQRLAVRASGERTGVDAS
jgi:uncharacterized membrane protein